MGTYMVFVSLCSHKSKLITVGAIIMGAYYTANNNNKQIVI